MSYRFVKITEFYPEFINGVYNATPRLLTSSYEVQLASLMGEGFGWGDFFARHLREQGIDAHEIVMNVVPLQRAWARENGLPDTASLVDTLWGQLEKLNPEVIFFENPESVDRHFLRRCRERLSNLRYLVGWCACPFTKKSLYIFSFFDLMLTSGIRFVQDFGAKGFPVRQMRHGFETDLLGGIAWGEEQKKTDVVFLGSFFSGAGFHDTRWRFFKNILASDIDMALHTSLPEERLLEIVDQRLLTAFQKTQPVTDACALDYSELADFLDGEGAFGEAKICRRIKKPVFGKQMFATLAQARVGIHVHPDVSGKFTGGMRPFEVTGVGSCLLTDWKEDLPEIFAVGEEVVAFHSMDEAYAHIDALLANPERRKAISKAGQEKVCAAHSYRHRAQELAGHIEDLFAQRVKRTKKLILPPSSLLIHEAKGILAQKAPSIHTFLKGVRQWMRG